MALISKDEVIKIAHISRIAIEPQEVDELVAQLESVLAYAQRVTQIGNQVPAGLGDQQKNVYRPDVIIKTNPNPLLDKAPAHESNYFVVPAILEHE